MWVKITTTKSESNSITGKMDYGDSENAVIQATTNIFAINSEDM